MDQISKSCTGAHRTVWTRSSKAPGRVSTHRAADQVRVCGQRQDREGPRPHDPAVATGAGRSGYRSMRTRSAVNAVYTSGRSLLVERQTASVVAPPANVHQPSIRARTAAHDVSIRSSTIAAADRRGWASHSMSRAWQTIDNPENARTGPSAWGSSAMARALPHGHGRVLGARHSPTPAKLLIVDLVAEHHTEAHEEFAGESDFRLRAAPAMQNGEVAAPK